MRDMIFLGLRIERRRRRPSDRFSAAEIDRTLLTLHELERAVFLNHRLRGMSYRKIASRLGITTDEVEQIITLSLHRVHWATRKIERERRP